VRVPFSAMLVVVGWLVLGSCAGEAGDQPEHRHMIYALAVAAGFTPSEAQVIADGSWSLDNNSATLALKPGLDAKDDVRDYVRFRLKATTDPAYAERLLRDNAALDQEIFAPKGGLARIGPAAFMHSLMHDPRAHGDDPNTPGLDAVYRGYMREQTRELQAGGKSAADVKTTQLLLVGQYMHQLVDSFVHPRDPLKGHLLELHGPDYAVNRPDAYAQAGFKALTAMRVILPEIRPRDERRDTALRFDTPEKQLQFTRGLVDAMARGYDPAYSPSHPERSRSTLRDASAIPPQVLARVTTNVEQYMGGALAERGSRERFVVPPFQNAAYTAGGNRFEIRYPGLAGGKVNVDNVVRWVLEHPDKHKDLAHAVRESMRREIRTWHTQGMSTVEVARDKVGGVLIRFAPGTWESGASEAESRQLIDRVHRFLETTGTGGLVLRPREPRLDLHVVSLQWVLDSGAPALGRLTRVLGYVLDPVTGLHLVGLAEPDREPIPVDLLVVALRAIWKSGQWPFVSLDPTNADDLAQPHAARIGGLSQDLEDTEFVRIMLEADYAMKRLDLGKDRPDIEGFHGWLDLSLAAEFEAGAGPVYRRAWFAPLVSPVGDVFETRREGASALVFESQVQVLTETMKQVGGYLVGTTRTEAVAAEAARLMTVHYEALEDYDPVFRGLRVVFDLAKLCALWRVRGMRDPRLDALAARTPARVDVPRRYAGLVADVGGRPISISGGAITRSRVSAKTVVLTDRLTPLLDAVAARRGVGEHSVGTIALPASLQIDPGQLASVSAEVLVTGAVADLTEGRPEIALARLDLALDLEPDLLAARAYRAVARLSAGQVELALEDVDHAVAAEPRLLALRALLLAYMGDTAAALRDAETAERGAGFDETILTWVANARLLAFDLPGAERLAGRLLDVSPLDLQAYNLLAQLDAYHAMGRARAEQRIAERRRMPIPIGAAYGDGMNHLRRLESEEAVSAMRRCRTLALESTAPAVRAAYMPERCGLGLAVALTMRAGLIERRDRDASRRLAAEAAGEMDAMIAEHPQWPSLMLVKGLAGTEGQMPVAETLALLHRALALGSAADPLMSDLAMALATDRVLAEFALTIYYQVAKRGAASEQEVLALLDALVPLFGTSLEGPLLDALRRGIRAPDESQALAIMRAAERTIPERLPPDHSTMLCAGIFYGSLVVLEGRRGDETHVLQAARRFLRLTNLEFRNWDALTTTAMFRLLAMGKLTDMYKRRIDAGVPEADVVAAARADDGPFVAAAVELDRRHERGTVEPARWGRLVDAAQSSVDLRSLLLFVEVFNATGTLGLEAEGMDLRQAIALIHAKLRASFRPRVQTAHAWESWK